MSNSPFKELQDPKNSGLVSQCEDVIISDGKECPDTPLNSQYKNPDWKSRDEYHPWLNEKSGFYEITVVTNETKIIPHANASEEEASAYLENMFLEYQEIALDSLLDYFEKMSDSDITMNNLKALLQHRRYDIDPRPAARVKLLYSIERHAIEDLVDLEEPEELQAPISRTHIFNTSELFINLRKVRRALHSYSRKMKIFQSVQNGSIVRKDQGSLFSLDRFGDSGMGGTGVLDRVFKDIDDFFGGEGYQLLDTNPSEASKSTAMIRDIELGFTDSWDLKHIKIFLADDPGKPVHFGEKRLKKLLRKKNFKDRTALAYFAQVNDMVRDLTAREPMPWLQFIVKYTYPTVTDLIGFPKNTQFIQQASDKISGNLRNPLDKVDSSVINALQLENKPLGFDILNEDFSLADSVLYAFSQNPCAKSAADLNEQQAKMNLSRHPPNPDKSTLITLAREQSFKEFTIDSNSLLVMAAAISQQGDTDEFSVESAREFARNVLARLKLSGLKDMLSEAADCLMSRMSLEQALPVIVGSAIKNMSLEDAGYLIDTLPINDKFSIKNLVETTIHGESANSAQSAASLRKYLESDVIPHTNLEPWTDRNILMQSKADYYNSAGGLGQASEAIQTERATTYGNQRRTLAVSQDHKTVREDSSSGYVMEVWRQEIVNFYRDQGRLLDLLESLNTFPGFPLLSKSLLLLNCPPSQLMGDLSLDFINDADMPLFRGIDDITMPALRNPLEWLPQWKDITSAIPILLKAALQKLIFSILSRTISKISGVIGSNSCLLDSGNFELDLSTLDNQDQIFDMVRDSLLDSRASLEEVTNTTKDIFSKLGFGAAVFEDQEKFMDFVYDMSSNLTRKEMVDMFTGNATSESLTVIDSLIDYDYPEYRDSLPTPEAISELTQNIGNLFPAEYKKSLKDYSNNMSNTDALPANPSLCASPDDLRDFCDNRKRLLTGRASEQQVEEMCESLQNDLAETLGDLLSSDPTTDFMNSLPPIQSDPGCDNGIIPFEPEAVSTAINKALDLVLQQVEIDFTIDMLGNGPSEANWGFLNMVMSDTLGNPLTAHYRKSQQPFGNYVDFVYSTGDGFQQGQFPYKIAEWMQYSLGILSGNFSSNNVYTDLTETAHSFAKFGIATAYNVANKFVDVELPKFGYGIKPQIDAENQTLIFLKEGMKTTPDMRLSFYDNQAGRGFGYVNPESTGTAMEPQFSYGFYIDLFVSDVEMDQQGVYRNRPSDNVRIKITDRNNLNAPISKAEFKSMTFQQKKDFLASLVTRQPAVQEAVAYEFLAIDDFVDLKDMQEYPFYNLRMQSAVDSYSPQVALLFDMITQRNKITRDFDGAIYNIKIDEVLSIYNNTYNNIFNQLGSEISGNQVPFLYGAQFDTLSEDDVDYVVKTGQTLSEGGTLYSEARVYDEALEAERSIVNEDAILGVSRDQYENELNGTPENTRVFYLDPAQFGELYVRPAMYVKPIKNNGWMNIIESLYPDFRTEESYDIIGFQEISDAVKKAQATIPLDERLRQDPDTVMELPYNRILERSSISSIQGIITATCRIFSSVHYLKSLATFMTFRPDFQKTMGSIYPQYIVEVMEKSLKSTSAAAWDLVSPFNDEEFWYLFLEQAVQTYGRLIDDGVILQPPRSVLAALYKINDMQERFSWYSKQEWLTTLEGRASGPNRYGEYVMREKIKAIKETEKEAKLVCKEFVKMELDVVNERFLRSTAASNGMKPVYTDLLNYFMRNFVRGAEGLNSILDAEQESQSTESEIPAPVNGDTSYNAGHAHVYDVDDNGNGWAYTAYHPERSNIFHKHEIINWQVQESQSNCYPECKETYGVEGLGPHVHYIGEQITTIGDVTSTPLENNYSETAINKPFAIQKYIKINNTRYTPDQAKTILQEHYNQNLNISDIYPGNLEIVYDSTDPERAVGLKGNLGIRYGLRLGMYSDFAPLESIELTSVEIDALDTEIDEFKFLEGDSFELECLIKKLYEDKTFVLVTKYLFPINKMISTIAIYNDLGFLPSIGEVTVETGEYKSELNLLDPTEFANNVDATSKPGVIVSFDSDWNAEYTYNEGWASVDDRAPGPFGGMFVREWDSWDQELLRNTKSRIKKIFKSYYFSKDFDETLEGMLKTNPGRRSTIELKNNLLPRSYMQQLKRWQRKLLRPNPFDLNGDIISNYLS